MSERESTSIPSADAALNDGLSEGLLGADVVVRGDITGAAHLRIDGVFQGKIKLTGWLGVAASGSVAGPVHVDVLEVAGEVQGEVVAEVAVAVRTGGRVEGDVCAPQVLIDDGAFLLGSISADLSRKDESSRSNETSSPTNKQGRGAQ